jgi:hypothetical protein
MLYTFFQAPTAQQLDISANLAFHLYEPVHFEHYTSTSATRHIPPNTNND